MDLAACDASGRGRANGSEHTASRRRWPRDIARGCLLYLVPTIIFFVVDAIGLWRLPGDFWGMYGNDDGIWAVWNLRGIFEWSRPFDLAPFNPLSGMARPFFPIPRGSIRRRLRLLCPSRAKSATSFHTLCISSN